MDLWTILGIVAVVVLGMGFAYWLGWRDHRVSMPDALKSADESLNQPGVVLIYAIPRDDVDIDIPRPHDGRMPC